ncbi:MAG: hypothetical protein ABI643_03545 [Candidatus Doudnabacteria bacterium]
MVLDYEAAGSQAVPNGFLKASSGASLQEWVSGRIKPMPNQPERFGIRIRIGGESPITEQYPANRK